MLCGEVLDLAMRVATALTLRQKHLIRVNTTTLRIVDDCTVEQGLDTDNPYPKVLFDQFNSGVERFPFYYRQRMFDERDGRVLVCNDLVVSQMRRFRVGRGTVFVPLRVYVFPTHLCEDVVRNPFAPKDGFVEVAQQVYQAMFFDQRVINGLWGALSADQLPDILVQDQSENLLPALWGWFGERMTFASMPYVLASTLLRRCKVLPWIYFASSFGTRPFTNQALRYGWSLPYQVVCEVCHG